MSVCHIFDTLDLVNDYGVRLFVTHVDNKVVGRGADPDDVELFNLFKVLVLH